MISSVRLGLGHVRRLAIRRTHDGVASKQEHCPLLPNSLAHRLALHNVLEGQAGERIANSLPQAVLLRVNGSLGLGGTVGIVEPRVPKDWVSARRLQVSDSQPRQDLSDENNSHVDARGQFVSLERVGPVQGQQRGEDGCLLCRLKEVDKEYLFVRHRDIMRAD